ncbi:MAG TPA: hypothetical protein VGO22_15420 [Pseudorhizobium sp.]|jgi:hypothetical protein|nr:hypothetical protein [Pseudorhizobium sp.]
MTKISMLAIDLAKGSFQVCAVGPDGAVLSNRALSRSRLLALLADHPACVVAMEACATSNHGGRVAQAHGHEVRLVPRRLREALRQAPVERSRGCRGHCGGGVANLDVLRGGEEHRDAGPLPSPVRSSAMSMWK